MFWFCVCPKYRERMAKKLLARHIGIMHTEFTAGSNERLVRSLPRHQTDAAAVSQNIRWVSPFSEGI